ncbi:MAG: glycoside hydrolase family 55 protein, partial [Chloroflexota bacterium]|nr:glycoside hydrolase family 55 protein [Chloroflexota bacterium]
MSGRNYEDRTKVGAAVGSGREVHRAALVWLLVITLVIAISQSSVIASLSRSALDQLVAAASGLFADARSGIPAVGELSAVPAQVAPAEGATGPNGNNAPSGTTTPAAGGAPAASGATLVAFPRAGSVGSKFDLSGTGFPTGRAVLLTWDGAGFATTMPSSKGVLQAAIVVPSTPIGPHALSATVLGTPIASTQFHVAAGSGSAPVAAQPTVRPPSSATNPPPQSSSPATPPPSSRPSSVPAPTPPPTPTAAPATPSPAPAVAVVDVSSYGARGDGVTDDTRALQAALAGAPSGSTVR